LKGSYIFGGVIKLKKIIVNLLLLSITLVLVSCNSSNANNPNLPIIQAAYDSLSVSEKKEINGDWRDANVDERVVTKRNGSLTDPNYDGKEVYVVTFSSKRSNVLGDISVYVSKDKKKVIGKGYRE
jgi:hypothetical protein